MIELYQHELETPVGVVYVVTDGETVRAVDFEGFEERKGRLLSRHYGGYTLHTGGNAGDAVSRLEAYFAGDLHALEGMPVATNGTAFQRRVWDALRAIPVGTMVSYATIADWIGQPKACRAVGLANGANPIGIVVPCHRVVGADASLTGYGGGLERKRWLLEHEGAVPSSRMQVTGFGLEVRVGR
jgi:methylated-DNA-[protein]-cysteine S-methyltransferase